MSHFRLSILLIVTLLGGGCGGYGSHSMGGNGHPAITSLTPATANAGDPAFTLNVNGSGFGTDSVVYWNGTALPSSYGTGSQVTAQVSATDVMAAGTFPVYVRSAGMNSNLMNFMVQ
jgi:phosphodiesterase/alkaline phosphatase D-like protein